MRDNSQDVLDLLARNINAALTAMGIKAESLIIGQMLRGFGRPIRKTGTLIGDVNYEIHPETKSVDVGNSKTYAIFVHEGTSRRVNLEEFSIYAINGFKILDIRSKDSGLHHVAEGITSLL